MSYTELQSGKITVIGKFTYDELNNYMKDVVKKELPDTYEKIIEQGFPSWCKDWFEAFNDNAKNQEMYIYRKETLFKVSNVRNYEDEGGFFYDAVKVSDNEYNFMTQYYNGGTCLYEILEEAADKMVDEL